MKRIKIIFAILILLLMGFVAFGAFTHKRAEKVNESQYSIPSVVNTLRVISEKPHSVEHPQEREEVRQYLYQRLLAMDSSARVYRYDSIKSKFGGHFDIGNVYACFNPAGADSAKAYVLMVAHLDSRYAHNVRGKQVYSFGAADDGYGVATILECVENALENRDLWKNGVKVLFTDSEEHDLDGMRNAYEKDKEIFEDVNLVVNIEARGVKGPVLLFETSKGNNKLFDFYSENSQYPYTYSLTSVVYGFMPNFTDFTVVRDDIPGYNFSLLDNINYYHTDKDNFSNISTNALAHYGAQIQPLLNAYLTSENHSSKDSFKGDSDAVAFSVPGLGTRVFEKGEYYILNALVLLLFSVAFTLYVKLRRVSLRNIGKEFLLAIRGALMFCGIGFLVSFVAAKLTGVPFSIVATKYIPGDTFISVSTIVLTTLLYIFYYMQRRRNNPGYHFEVLFGTLLLMTIIAAVLLFAIGENFFILLPVGVALVAMILHTMVYLNNLSIFAVAVIELLGVSFLYNLLTALTIGSLGVIMFLAYFYVVLMVSLIECYMFQKR
ncbi:MAG: M28 family peptidase [Bacteroidales bacterium]|nr:M28 family peptidase [Bacteroidales bacterium]